jgi:hypothetical protein
MFPVLFPPPKRRATSAAGLASSGLVVEFRCNEGSGTTLTDYASGLNGTFGATTAAPSWSGAGVVFDGSSDYIDGGQPAGLPTGNSDRTMQIVCNRTRAGAFQGVWATGDTGTTRGNFAIGATSGNNISIFVQGDDLSPAVAFDAGYQMITARYTGSSRLLEMIKNTSTGSPSTRTLGGNLVTATTPYVTLGTLRTSAGATTVNWYGGTLAYGLLYSRALSNDEITANYAYLQTLLAGRGITLA